MKPLHKNQEVYADIGGHLVEATVTNVTTYPGAGPVYDIIWKRPLASGASELQARLGVIPENLFATWDEAHKHCLDRAEYWDRMRERLEEMPEDEPDPDTLAREEQDAYEDMRAEELREAELTN